jgi:hypothetical protein
MEMSLAYKALIAAAFIFGGGVMIGLFISFMYRHLKIVGPKCLWAGFNLLVLAIGFTEQMAAILLIYFSPLYLAPFVGGWIGLKYAAGWQPSGTAFAREKSLLALIGTVWSFGFGIAAGLLINKNAIDLLWKTHV